MKPAASTLFPPDRRTTLLSLLFCLATAFLAYANVLNGPFFFDDELFIVRNRFLSSLRFLPALFASSPSAGASIAGDNFYRPLTMAAFALLRALVGLKPWAFHALSVFTHGLNGFLLMGLLARLGFSRRGAAWGAVLFLLHPVQTQAVAYVSGLGDPLAVLFMLAGLRGLLESEGRGWMPAAGALLCEAGGLLSKEIGVVFPFWAALVWLSRPREARRKWTVFLWAAFAMAAGYVALKLTLFSFSGRAGLTAAENIYTQRLDVRITTGVSVLWDYARLLLWPARLTYEKPYTAYVGLLSWRGAFGVGILAGAAGAAARSWRKGGRGFIGMGWFFAALGPVSGLVPLNAMFLEHWLYAPMAGLGLLAAAVHDRLRGSTARTMFAAFGAAAVALSLPRVWSRNAEWADPARFYLNELRVAEGSARIHNNLAMIYSDRGRPDLAVPHYRRAIALNDIYPQTHHNLAGALLASGDAAGAEREFLLALRLDPSFPYSLEALARLYAAAGRPDLAASFAGLAARAGRGERLSREEVERVVARFR